MTTTVDLNEIILKIATMPKEHQALLSAFMDGLKSGSALPPAPPESAKRDTAAMWKEVREMADIILEFNIYKDWQESINAMSESIDKIKEKYPDAELHIKVQFEQSNLIK